MAVDFGTEIERALSSSRIVAKPDYLEWCTRGDLASQARAYAFSARAWDRIVPEPTMEEQCGFMSQYLIRCLCEDPESDGFLHNGFEAAHALAEWLKHLAGIDEAAEVIARVAEELSLSYKRSSNDVRVRIETGALEHVLESPALRPYFEPWGSDSMLMEPYARAIEWVRSNSDDAV